MAVPLLVPPAGTEGPGEAPGGQQEASVQEQAVSTYLWFVWKQCMQETTVPGFRFVPWQHKTALAKALGIS